MDPYRHHRKLVLIKLLHTSVWIFFNIVLIYLYYATITNQIGIWFWLGVGAFFLEFIILIVYGWNCPITFWAKKYSNSSQANFDIYLPNWLAQHNKTIYSILIVVLIIIFIMNQYIK